MEYTIQEERLSPEEYIGFLKETDLGSQYPKERFAERIATLVQKASISLVARSCMPIPMTRKKPAWGGKREKF